METATDIPESRFRAGETLQTDDGSLLTVERFEATGRSPLLAFEEVNGRDEADVLRGTYLYIGADRRRELEEGEFWPDDLVGMDVVHADGARLGRVTEVETGVGQYRLLVETDAGPLTVPFVQELVPEVNTEQRRIVVDLPEGFMD